MSERISVVVPIYKVEKYLAKCIESIINQTYRNLEIILIDDGSPDGCCDICDSYAKVDSRIVVIHKKNGGLSSARNAGIDVSTGEYIGFVDSDDFIEPYMYELLMQAIVENSCLLSVCSVNYAFEDGKKIAKAPAAKDEVFEFAQAITEMNTYRFFDMGAWSKLYHRSLFEEIRFPIGKLSEDFYIMYKVFDKAQRVAFVAKTCYNYLQRQNSITRNTKINHDFEFAACEQMQFLDQHYPELTVLGHTSYASAVLTVFDFYLKNGVHCPSNTLSHFKSVVQQNRKFIDRAEYLSLEKKIQFHLFAFSTHLYNLVFKTYRTLKKV